MMAQEASLARWKASDVSPSVPVAVMGRSAVSVTARVWPCATVVLSGRMTTFAGRGVGVAVGVVVGVRVGVAVAVAVGVAVGVKVAVAVVVAVTVGVAVGWTTRARAAVHGMGASARQPDANNNMAAKKRPAPRLNILPAHYFALYNGQDENSSRVHM